MTPSLLAHYQTIEHISSHMVQAAVQGKWEEVTRLEDACGQLVKHTNVLARSVTPSSTEKAIKQQLLLAILRHDAQVLALANPELHRQYAAMRFPAVKSAAPLPIVTGN